MKNNIWLFGENESRTMNNNSFYFWKKVCSINDQIEKYFIAEKNKQNKKIYKSLNNNEKKLIIWKNSIKHWIYFYKSTMNLVSLSYKDITPSKLLFFKANIGVKKPIIYLQHGTIAIKKLGYKGNGYNNNFFRFFIYNQHIIPTMIKENDFKPYQLYYAKYHPRYMELIKRSKINKNNKQILYFLTWREYLGNNKETEKLIDNLELLVSNKKLTEYLHTNNIKFKICLHQFFDSSNLERVYKKLNAKYFEIVTPSKIDIMDEIATSEVLITDFSSIGFDFTFLKKPVILFSPDFDEYLKNRELYCQKKELKENTIINIDELINNIINKKYSINNFFQKRLPQDIDYKYIEKGNHILDMYNYLKEKQLNKILFIGYKYGGSGGTVSATKSLAESLLEKGYLVEMLSLKGSPKAKTEFPYGANETRITQKNRRITTRVIEKISRMINFIDIFMGSLKYDTCKKYLVFNIKNKLKKYLEKTNAKTVVSTRESLHPILSEIKNNTIKNKVYFFHTDANLFDTMFPGLNKIINNYTYDKLVFVSKTNYKKYKEKFNLKYNNYVISGNCIEDGKIIDKSKIKSPGKKDNYRGICLTRISKDRKKDIDNILLFGEKLKKLKKDNIIIDLYGIGDIVNYLNEEIEKRNISKYINYQGLTKDSFNEIIKHDFLIDFSTNQSFGMIYLEGILAGKKVFANSNDGSNEVLEEIKGSIYNNFDELINYLDDLDKITAKELIYNYELILSKYSKDEITNKFLNIIK